MSDVTRFTPEEQLEIVSKGCADILPKEALLKRLKKSYDTKTPLRVKLGIDPTGSDIHLGHTVVLFRLKAFQECGHQIVFFIGDYTAMIGDPTGRSSTRPMLTHEEILKNAENYKKQVGLILDTEKTDFVYNSKWLGELKFSDIIRLTSYMTVAQMLERDDFTKRYTQKAPISLVEFLYPLMQGYDSVAQKIDVEFGGQDQLFNLLVGRELQKQYGQESQIVMTLPLLEGTDGVQKMSKSYGNIIALDDTPSDMFGKVMSIPDTLMPRYYELLTSVSMKDIKDMQTQIENGANPRDFKLKLAYMIVESLKGSQNALFAQEEFINVFSKKADIPSDTPNVILKSPTNIIDLMMENDLAESRSQCKRLILQGGVSLDGVKIESEHFSLNKGQEGLIKVGKKRFLKLINN